MNYIKRIQSEIEQHLRDKHDARVILVDLQRYLLSGKFRDDPTVQVQDVLNRLSPLVPVLMD
jgi:hypothetical protein